VKACGFSFFDITTSLKKNKEYSIKTLDGHEKRTVMQKINISSIFAGSPRAATSAVTVERTTKVWQSFMQIFEYIHAWKPGKNADFLHHSEC
jgi:hypothetical protein